MRSFKDVQFIPNVKKALARVSNSEYKIVLVTNQSAIGRRIISLEHANLINVQIVRKIVDSGGRMDGVFLCPYHPNENCPCRKPAAGLFKETAKRLSLHLNSSIVLVILGKIYAGQRAGVDRYIFILTGKGKDQIAHTQRTQ